MFDSISGSIRNAVNKIRHKDDVASLKKAIVELKKSLLKADVHHKTTKELITAIELETKRVGIGQDSFINALKLELTKVLTTEGNQGFVYSNTQDYKVLVKQQQLES